MQYMTLSGWIQFLVFLVAMTMSPNFPLLLVFLFGMGLALNRICDLPVSTRALVLIGTP